jgi:hypothetical protein
MPVQIGAQAHKFSNPTGLLSDRHRRIEMFLGALEGVGSLIDRPLTKQTRVALESALRYFREAAPKHTADEEESLFPRRRKMHLPDVEAAIARLDPLEHDHLLAGSLHAEVEELGQRYISVGSLESTGVEAFRKSDCQMSSCMMPVVPTEVLGLVSPHARIMYVGKTMWTKEHHSRRDQRLITAI